MVVVFDKLFDGGDEDGLHLAAGASVASQADEVGVDVPVAGPVHGDGHPGAAFAVEHAFQEVDVGALAAVGAAVGVEDVLDFLPGGGFDERVVGSGVAGSHVDQVAFVVGVAQDAVQGGDTDGFGWAFRCSQGRQAAQGEFVGKGGQGPSSGGERFERPGDERCAGRVDVDGAVLAPVLVTLTDVEVAYGRLVRGSSGDGFLP